MNPIGFITGGNVARMGYTLLIGVVIGGVGLWKVQEWRWTANTAAEKLAESEGKRQREKAATIANQGVDRDLQASNKRRAAAERATADSLRELQAALNQPDPVTVAASGTHGTGGLERELLGQCANSLAAMALTADRLEGKVVGLQGYVNQVVQPAK